MGNLLFSPSGRIGPQEFVKGIMIIAVISAVITIVPMFSYSLGTMLSLVSIVLLYPIFCLLIKRSHDAGKSGWMSIVWFILYIIIVAGAAYIAQKFSMGDLGVQMEEASKAAAEEGDFAAIMAVANEYGPQIARKTALPSALAGLVGTYVFAMILNMILKPQMGENQYG